MKRNAYVFTILICLSLACNLGTTVAPTAQPASGGQSPDQGDRCGDGVCEGPENGGNCPVDCTAADQSGAVAEQKAQPALATDDVYLWVEQSAFYQGTSDECWYDPDTHRSKLTNDSVFKVLPATADGSVQAPLLFTIIVHIEPAQEYATLQAYLRDRNRVTRMAEMLAAHGGKLTIQTQRPFITTSQAEGDDIHRHWEGLGHEIAIHFHEDRYVKGALHGAQAPFEEWVTQLSGLGAEIQGLVDNPVVTWSGGNLYEQIYQAAAQAALSVNTNYKDPTMQAVDPVYLTVSPWRPRGLAASTGGAAHDPDGPVVYLPAGMYPAHCDKPAAVPRPYTTQGFDYITTALIHSLNVARSGYVNVSYTTFHPGDFRTPEDDEHEFARWDEWLTKVFDPLVADGRLQWATASEMAHAFADWEAR
ncbi:MAG: hypothetical protein ACE5E7_07525 [Anaerolineae bacterium]